MERELLIIEIKGLLHSTTPPDEKYLFYAKNRYQHIKDRKGPNWIDYIYIYKGVFSLWKPVLKVKWIYSDERTTEITKSLLNIETENEFCFNNKLSEMETDSLKMLKKDLITLSI